MRAKVSASDVATSFIYWRSKYQLSSTSLTLLLIGHQAFIWTPSKLDQCEGSCASVSVAIFLTERHR